VRQSASGNRVSPEGRYLLTVSVLSLTLLLRLLWCGPDPSSTVHGRGMHPNAAIAAFGALGNACSISTRYASSYPLPQEDPRVASMS
jgi:hypothetical protein